jgi:transposase-like protein
METKKRNRLPVSEKLLILQRLDNNESMSAIARDYGLNKTAIWQIKKNRQTYEEFSKTGNVQAMSIKSVTHGKLEAAMMKFIEQAQENGINLSRGALQDKALQFADLLQIENFKASNGWLQRFMFRHEIDVKTLKNASDTKTESNGSILNDEEILQNIKAEEVDKPAIVLESCRLCKVNTTRYMFLVSENEYRFADLAIKNFPYLELVSPIEYNIGQRILTILFLDFRTVIAKFAGNAGEPYEILQISPLKWNEPTKNS